MIVPTRVRAAFDDLAPYVTEIGRRVTETVFAYCTDQGFAFISRPKTLESLAEKIETGRFRRWSQIDDLFACTIVVPTLREEPRTIEYLARVFDQVEVRKRGNARKQPEVFRFDATRFVGRLRTPGPDFESERLFQTPFEVQIRSAFEHAWSATTHALVYKSQSIDWKRLRLAAQLKAAVEQLDSLVLAFDVSAEHITEHHWPEISARAKIAQFFAGQVESGRLIPELAPKDLSRFSENVLALILSANHDRRTEIDLLVDNAIDCIDSELKATTPEKMPRSISLFQFVLGVLTRFGHLRGPLRNFCPIVTDELAMLYPEVVEFQSQFEFDTGM